MNVATGVSTRLHPYQITFFVTWRHLHFAHRAPLLRVDALVSYYKRSLSDSIQLSVDFRFELRKKHDVYAFSFLIREMTYT